MRAYCCHAKAHTTILARQREAAARMLRQTACNRCHCIEDRCVDRLHHLGKPVRLDYPCIEVEGFYGCLRQEPPSCMQGLRVRLALSELADLPDEHDTSGRTLTYRGQPHPSLCIEHGALLPLAG